MGSKRNKTEGNELQSRVPVSVRFLATLFGQPAAHGLNRFLVAFPPFRQHLLRREILALLSQLSATN
jgi:hypothetical protein